MKPSKWKPQTLITITVFLLSGYSAICSAQSDEDINICKLVNDAQIQKLHRKHLYPTAYSSSCNWSEKPGGMAEINIQISDEEKPLRAYFDNPLPSRFKLVKITDLGNGGLMTVGEGAIGVVAIRKGKRVLLSSPTFLDIAPGSKKQAILWDIYRKILKKL